MPECKGWGYYFNFSFSKRVASEEIIIIFPGFPLCNFNLSIEVLARWPAGLLACWILQKSDILRICNIFLKISIGYFWIF
jgi:hypothetical protein